MIHFGFHVKHQKKHVVMFRALAMIIAPIMMVCAWHRTTMPLPRDKIQFLTLKNNGQSLTYFDPKQKCIVSSERNNPTTLTRIPLEFVYDIDSEKWNDTIHHMIAYYDADEHHVWNTNFRSKSMIKRCLFLATDHSLTRLIFTQDGRMVNVTTTMNRHEPTITTTTTFPFHIFSVERYNDYIYIIDATYRIHIVDDEGRWITLRELESSTPVVNIHVYSIAKTTLRMTLGYWNRTVSQFDISKDAITHVLTIPTENILKVFADPEKILVVNDRGSILAYDAEGVYQWRVPKACDPNYVTRLHATETSFIVDGTDGIIVYERLVQVQRPGQSVFMINLMKIPRFRMEHLQGNWSFTTTH